MFVFISAFGWFSNPIVLWDPPEEFLIFELRTIWKLAGWGGFIEKADGEAVDVAVFVDCFFLVVGLGVFGLELEDLGEELSFDESWVFIEGGGFHVFEWVHGLKGGVG